MRVTRIEVFGFKSFMDRLLLPLTGGVTAVVGPNGCGKSNIVDAVRWVLGETRASSLRGGVLEDVIFNGTDKLRPLGLAEVSLTLRASEEDFFANLVSPQLEAQQIAEQAKELDEAAGDIVEPQPDTKRPHLKLVTPESAVESPDNSPEETSSTETRELSEADSSTGDEVPFDKEDLTDSVPNTDPEREEVSQVSALSMASRFGWLKSTSEVQVTRRLYRSGESEFFINRVPCRLKDLKDFFRAIGLAARGYTIVAQGEVSRIVTSKPEQRRQILEEAAGVVGFRDKIAEAERRLKDTKVNISRLEDITKELDRQVSSLQRKAQKAKARGELKREIYDLDHKLFYDSLALFEEKKKAAEKELHETKALEEGAEQALKEAVTEEERVRGEMVSIDSVVDEIRVQLDLINAELNRRAQEENSRRSRLKELVTLRESREREVGRLQQRKETLVERRQQAIETTSQLESEEAEVSKELQEFEQLSEDELRSLAGQLAEARKTLREKEHALRGVRDQLISHRSRLQAVEEQLVAASPVTRLEKSLGSSELSDVRDKVKLLVEGIRAPRAFSKALQAVLADKAQFLVAEDPHAIGRRFLAAIERLSDKQKKGFGVGVVKTGSCEIPAPLFTTLPRLIDLLEVNDDVKHAVYKLLEEVYFSEGPQQALQFFEESKKAEGISRATVVTAEGDIITDASFFSMRHDSGVIQLRVHQRELRVAADNIEKEHEILQKERDELTELVTETEKRHAEALRESQQKQAAARELGRKQGSLRGRLQSERRVAQQIDQDLARTEIEVNQSLEKIEALKDQEEKAQAELSHYEGRSDDGELAKKNALHEELKKQEEKRRDGRKRLSDTANHLNRARSELDRIRGAASQCSLTFRRIELERQSLVERLTNEYGEEHVTHLVGEVDKGQVQIAELSAEDRKESRERLAKLKARIIREGEVDPSSIQQYEDEKVRLDDLLSQKQDLATAAQVLQQTLESLIDNAEKRFIETFEAIRKGFQTLIPRVFGGGEGDLLLTDPEKPMQGGVDITVRPPGKKPKSIELLSGGEKALCATALIMAMFQERPSPLCILDEVDAPLDEANLLRFLDLIKEMGASTQFIMITHNKQSMAMADKLVGVTMEQPGASKMISVTLEEAVDQVA